LRFVTLIVTSLLVLCYLVITVDLYLMETLVKFVYV